MKHISMNTFYSKLSTELLKVRLAEFNKMPILTYMEGHMKETIEKILRKRGAL